MRVLIVDDKLENLYYLESLLKGSGYRVTTAKNGGEAMDLLEKDGPFNLIVSDILMPVVDGFELCRRVKKDARFRAIPFVFYTATYTEKKDEEFALGLGASKFLIKPLEPEAFIQEIRETLNGTQNEDFKQAQKSLNSDEEIFKLYNERLIKKLEKKMLDLEEEQKKRREGEKELKMLAHAIKSIRECVFITDLKDQILFVNDSFVKTYGYAHNEIKGKKLDQLFASDNSGEVLKSIKAQTLKGGWKGELLQQKKDGTIFPASVSTSVVRDEKNKALAKVGAATDISEKQKLEEQFRQAQKMEAIGRLAGGIAHDFNNLLTVINGYSELLMMNLKKNDPIYLKLKEISHAGGQAESLTAQLLAFSRKQVLQPVVLDIHDVFVNLDKMLKRLIGEHIELNLLMEPEISHIKADPGQIEQVILNLVINARDAMPLGGILTIELKNVIYKESFTWEDIKIEPGTYLMMAISDTGSGMDATTRSMIFEPFFTTKKEGEGTGLGLSMVYGIIKQSGGFINVYSEPGAGTTFKIYFPCVEAPAEKLDKNDFSSSSLDGNETILVAEDEDNLRNLTCEILRTHGYHVLEAANGGSALLKCEKFTDPIHLILSDVVMPEMSGAELVERLTTIHPEMKVLYMSGYTDDAVIRHGILEEKVQFLQKPFSPTTLLEKIRTTLAAKKKTSG